MAENSSTTEPERKVPLQVKIPVSLREELRAAALMDAGRSMTSFVVASIRERIDRIEANTRQGRRYTPPGLRRERRPSR